MKTKSKALLMTLCAVLLVAASVLGTMAYLTSTDKVTNTFTIGTIGIKLDEAKVNTDGTPVQGAARVNTNTYKLMPGREYTKDPTVWVDANSENSYIFVKVENEIANIEADTKIAAQIKAKGWMPLAGEAGVYYKTYTQQGTIADLVVFEKFTIKNDVNADTLKDYAGKTIKITAYAVQQDNLTVAQAWDAAKALNA